MLTAGNVHVDQPLTTFSQMYSNEDYIFDRVLNSTKVGKISDLYWKYSKKVVYAIADSALGESAVANEIGLKLDGQGSYSTQEYGLAGYVSDRSVQNADNPLAPRMDTVRLLLNSLQLEQETRAARLIFNTGTYPVSNVTTLATGSQWDKEAADPVGDVQDLMRQTFRKPNVLVFGPLVWDAFRSHEKVLRALSGATLTQGANPSGGLATRQAIADLFEVAEVLVPEAKVDANPYEHAVEDIGYIWGKSCVALYRMPGTLSPRSVTFATRFYVSPMTVLTEYVQARRSERLQAFYDEDLKLIAPDLGAMIASVIP